MLVSSRLDAVASVRKSHHVRMNGMRHARLVVHLDDHVIARAYVERRTWNLPVVTDGLVDRPRRDFPVELGDRELEGLGLARLGIFLNRGIDCRHRRLGAARRRNGRPNEDCGYPEHSSAGSHGVPQTSFDLSEGTSPFMVITW